MKYKNQPKNAGIYFIKNIINSKFYIGSTCNFQIRQRAHFRKLETQTHSNVYLQDAYNKYGAKNFEFLPVASVFDPEKLEEVEQSFLDEYRTYDREIGYNLCKKSNNTMGRIFRDETIEKFRNRWIIPDFICEENQEVFHSTGQAARAMYLDMRCIGACLRGEYKSTGGYHFYFIDKTLKEKQQRLQRYYKKNPDRKVYKNSKRARIASNS